MAAKAVFVLCASALLVQIISGQCVGYANNLGGLGYGNNLAGIGGCGCGAGLGGGLSSGVASASGGGLTVSSSSPIAPSGIYVVSENAIEGPLTINGQLPVLAAVALEGQLPSSGSAGVSYSCGDNNVGISSQSLSAAGIGNSNAAGLGLASAGYGSVGLGNNGLAGINSGLAGYGGIGGLSLAGSQCGCGSIY